jgi:hypothetical protein
MEQLAANVAGKLHQLTGLLEETTLSVELLDTLGKRPQQCLKVASATFVVRLFRLRHGGEAASLKDRCAWRKASGIEVAQAMSRFTIRLNGV